VPIDFSALRAGRADPVASPERWAALVGRIEAAAAPELARRADRAALRNPGPWLIENVASAVARFTTPALVAAAAAVIIAVGVSWRAEQSSVDLLPPTDMVATQLLSDDSAAWVSADREFTAADLVRAIDPE